MHNYFYSPDESGLSTSDYIAIIAVVVSIASLIFSIHLIYLTKRMEILYQEFETLCLKNVGYILAGLDIIFEENELSNSRDYRTQITTSMVELQMFLVSLKQTIYPKIDVPHIVKITESFSEKIYAAPDANLLEFKGDFYSAKLEIYNSLYIYALQKELKFFIQKRPKHAN